MKRILMLNYEFPPLGGGAASATQALLGEFAKREDIEIDLVTSSTGAFSEERISERIRVFRLDVEKSEKLHSQSLREIATYSIKALAFAKRLKARGRYDLVHAFFGVPCGAIALLLDLPYLVSLRGSDVPGFNARFRLLERLFLSRLSRAIWAGAQRVVANSSSLARLARRTWDGPIEIIGNGVDASRFLPSAKEHAEFIVLSTSRLIERKGVDILIRAFAAFSAGKTGVRLALAGGGVEYTSLRKLAASFPSAQIQFLGEVPRLELPRYYAHASAFALLSESEGMSNSLLEAAASGLAIIATKTGDVERFLGDSVLTVERDEASVATALERIYSDRALRDRLCAGARKAALDATWKKAADAYERIYSDIIQK